MQAWNKVNRMSVQAIKKMQDELLRKMVGEMEAGHPYYRALFREKGIDFADLKGVDDLAGVPLTVKSHMLPRDDDPFHPRNFVLDAPPEGAKKSRGGFKLFGKKDAVPDPRDYRLNQLFYTAGRTAAPVPLSYTACDVANLREAGMRAFDILGMGEDDAMVNAFSFAPNVSYWQMFHSTIDLGATALQTGGGRVLGLEKILTALENMEAQVMATFPGYALFALETAVQFGATLHSLERIIMGMDYAPMAQVERVKKLMEKAGGRGNRVQRLYFVSEAKSGWAECEPGYGYHTNPDHVLIEVVDPETGEPRKEGEAGEIVITNLDGRGTLFLRFRTGDMATGGMTTEPCPACKRTVPRILGDIERKELYFDLQGEGGSVRRFNGNAMRHFMLEQDHIKQWYVEICRPGEMDTLKVVLAGAGEEEAKVALEKEFSERFQAPVTVETATFEAVLDRIGMEKNITEQRIFDLRG